MTATATTAHLAHCARNPCTCEAEAVADQVAQMRSDANIFLNYAASLAVAGLHGPARKSREKYAALSANADRLEARAASKRQTL